MNIKIGATKRLSCHPPRAHFTQTALKHKPSEKTKIHMFTAVSKKAITRSIQAMKQKKSRGRTKLKKISRDLSVTWRGLMRCERNSTRRKWLRHKNIVKTIEMKESAEGAQRFCFAVKRKIEEPEVPPVHALAAHVKCVFLFRSLSQLWFFAPIIFEMNSLEFRTLTEKSAPLTKHAKRSENEQQRFVKPGL